jgi:trehalose 2-sulfotransferase
MIDHSLYETGYFRFPLEYANPVNLAEWKKRFGKESLPEVLTKLLKCRTSPNGVFGN